MQRTRRGTLRIPRMVGSRMRRRPILACWLLLQLITVLYFAYLYGVRGVRDHHFGMALWMAMGALLFPGSLIVTWTIGASLVLVGVLVVGHPLSVQNELVAWLLSLFAWATSAALSLRFWTSVKRWLDRDSKPDMGWKWDPTPMETSVERIPERGVMNERNQ
jgi:hypothetical protein